MRKPVSEHSTTIKARKGDKSEPHTNRMEAVGGGKVRRVEFEETPVFREERHEREWRPRSDDSIDSIHFEVDNLERIRRGAPPRERRNPRRAEAPDEPPSGSKPIYTTRRRGGRVEEQRFHSGMVDRVLARSGHGPTFESVQEEPKRGLLTRRRQEERPSRRTETAKPAAKPSKPTAQPKPATKPAKPASPTKPAAKTAQPTPAKPDFQPQCEAVTQAGVQCRNSAKAGSGYCGSHQKYRPRRLQDVLDTKPARGTDTLPGAGDHAGTGQCAAYTQAGVQCRNSSRKNSKYCASHKGYRAPSKASLEKRLDTKPRHAGAKDTVPKMRK